MDNSQDYRAPSAQSGTVRVTRFPIESINLYEITEEDLSVISRLSFQRALHTFLAGMGFSAAVSLGIVVGTVPISDPRTYATLIAFTIVAILVFLYSTGMFIRNEVEASQSKKRIFRKHENG